MAVCAFRHIEKIFAFSIRVWKNPAVMLLLLQKRWFKCLLTHSISARCLICGQHASKPLRDMMWLFICSFWSHKGILYVFFLFCLSPFFLYFSLPESYNLSSGEIVPLSFLWLWSIFLLSLGIKWFSIKKVHTVQWPWLYSARLSNEFPANSRLFFCLFVCFFLVLFVPIELWPG